MKEFYIYYRSQNINQIRAKNAAAALAKHYKSFAKGSKGREIACAADSSMAEFEAAMRESELPAN